MIFFSLFSDSLWFQTPCVHISELLVPDSLCTYFRTFGSRLLVVRVFQNVWLRLLVHISVLNFICMQYTYLKTAIIQKRDMCRCFKMSSTFGGVLVARRGAILLGSSSRLSGGTLSRPVSSSLIRSIFCIKAGI